MLSGPLSPRDNKKRQLKETQICLTAISDFELCTWIQIFSWGRDRYLAERIATTNVALFTYPVLESNSDYK